MSGGNSLFFQEATNNNNNNEEATAATTTATNSVTTVATVSNPVPVQAAAVNQRTNTVVTGAAMWREATATTNDGFEPNDDFDSDQLDEDEESYSWASTDNQDIIMTSGGGGGGAHSRHHHRRHGSNSPGANNGNSSFPSSSQIPNWRDWKHPNPNPNNAGSSQMTDFLINILNARNNPSSYTTPQWRQIPKLVDLCARFVAENIPFERVETYGRTPIEEHSGFTNDMMIQSPPHRHPIPEDLQLKITAESFPSTIDNIRLYSCLVNGNVDEYLKGEQLYQNGCVRKIIQIGFHLSAEVLPLNYAAAQQPSVVQSNLGSTNNNQNNYQIGMRSNRYNYPNPNQSSHNNNNRLNYTYGSSSTNLSVARVSIVCDRKRITSCTCTCQSPRDQTPLIGSSSSSSPSGSLWCGHIVAAALYRILQPHNVQFRAPILESLFKLDQGQLQKFALHLIAELITQQILPTAQRLLDDLIQNADSSINQQSGAPDPTAGASESDASVWCMDEPVLQYNINRTLAKFVQPTPHVVSDLECLEHTSSSAAAAEYTALMRPLKGREPEGMWNLVSIVREMFRRRDRNGAPLLRVITVECLAFDQIVQHWYWVKSSQSALNNSSSFNIYSGSQRGTNGGSNQSNGGGGGHNSNNPSPPMYLACANLMDELVSLWRIACLNPLLPASANITDTDSSSDNRELYREQLIQWHQSVYERVKRSSSTTAPGTSNGSSRRHDLFDLFSGFLPAIYACDMTWDLFDFHSVIVFKQHCIQLLNEKQEIREEKVAPEIVETEEKFDQPQKQQEATKVDTKASNDLNSLYMFDYDPAKMKSAATSGEKERDWFKLKPAANNLSGSSFEENKLEILFSRCEALYAHGFIEHACVLARLLADYCLKNSNFGLFICPNNESESSQSQSKPTTSTTNNWRHRCITQFQSTLLWRSYFLAALLQDASAASNPINEDDDDRKESSSSSSLSSLAFRVGLLGLETPRLPAASKSLEVKLINHEQELVSLLKRLPIGASELASIRDRARQLTRVNLRERSSSTYWCYSLPLLLASYLFDVLHALGGTEDEELAFECALAAIGMKAHLSESQHALLCEGIRRQKGELALTLLVTYKDDEARLLRIMDKILDRELHVLFRSWSSFDSPQTQPAFNPFSPNLKKLQQQQLLEYQKLGLDDDDDEVVAAPEETRVGNQQSVISSSSVALSSSSDDEENNKNKKSAAISGGNTVNGGEQFVAATVTNSLSRAAHTKMSNRVAAAAIDSLSSGWEESENESPNLSNDVSLLETKYRCLALKQQQQQSQQPTTSVASVATSSDNSPSTNNNRKQIQPNQQQENQPQPQQQQQANLPSKLNSKSVDDSGDDSSSSSAADTKNPTTSTNTSAASSTLTNPKQTLSAPTVPKNLASSSSASSSSSSSTNKTLKSTNNIDSRKFSYQELVNQMNSQVEAKLHNQASEALVHYMFEFAKTVLKKAGGSVTSTSMFSNHQHYMIGSAHQTQPHTHHTHFNNGGNGAAAAAAGVATTHRNLHICSFLISLYALGLHNQLQQTWTSRMYSTQLTWINSLAVEIGFPAICVLLECWQGHLTPYECVSLADKVSRGRDNMAVIASAELAFASLRFASSMSITEIQRAFSQCKEQNADMLRRACRLVENAVVQQVEAATQAVVAAATASSSALVGGGLIGGSNQVAGQSTAATVVVVSQNLSNLQTLHEIYFAVAKRWDELYQESLRAHSNAQAEAAAAAAAAAVAASSTAEATNTAAIPTSLIVSSSSTASVPLANHFGTNNDLGSAFDQLLAANQSQLGAAAAAQQLINTIPPHILQYNLMQQSMAAMAAAAAAAASLNPVPYMPPPLPQHHHHHHHHHLYLPPSQSGAVAPPQQPTAPLSMAAATSFLPPQVAAPISQHPPTLPPNNAANVFQLNPLMGYQQQQHFNYQNLLRQQQQLQQQQQQLQQRQLDVLDSTSLKYLKSAYRVGMLGLEAIAKRTDGPQVKYRQSPPFADDVKWLCEIAYKLDLNQLAILNRLLPEMKRIDLFTYIDQLINQQWMLLQNKPIQEKDKSYLHDLLTFVVKDVKEKTGYLHAFCQKSAQVLQNPFLVQEIIIETSNYICRHTANAPNQFTPVLQSLILKELIDRCTYLYSKCCQSKLNHLTQNEYEDYINMILTARNLYICAGRHNEFTSLCHNVRKAKHCKKDLWNKISYALNQQH